MQHSSGQGAPPEQSSRVPCVWCRFGVAVAAGLAAQAVTVVLTEIAGAMPLLSALLATLTFAGVWLSLSTRTGAVAPSLQLSLRMQIHVSCLIFAGIFLGARLMAAIVGDAHSFYCEPAVPWTVEIAIFGSFTVSVLTRIAEAHGSARLAYPLILMALLWIAPFYGFFLAPMFLAIGLVAGCADHGVVPVVLASFGMVVGERLGNGLGAWMSKPSDRGNVHL